VLAAAERQGRVRLAHAGSNDTATLKRFCDGHIAKDVSTPDRFSIGGPEQYSVT
jgi:hypothetical protein